MGLAVMPDGVRRRRVGGADALDHGYSPARRSVVWNIGACIVKAGGPLKAAYDTRKLLEAERVATKAHAHARAQRYVEKRFIRSLWREWRRRRPTGPPPDKSTSAMPGEREACNTATRDYCDPGSPAAAIAAAEADISRS